MIAMIASSRINSFAETYIRKEQEARVLTPSHMALPNGLLRDGGTNIRTCGLLMLPGFARKKVAQSSAEVFSNHNGLDAHFQCK